ncbi:ketopantoate reductase family protein [Salipiger mucosus]|uniref:2-dehydropantoate 2-reductase n=1 Tax=Salipiger mucosus DSM 16094 TaxID=1123237 RepID=S9RPH5_9RHOB|nr:2-dehydropantoate 2-reductase N-terminal domain-containing protein [Salipiger mucosus]EPX75939.1 2-dehydropantoate 2-reductase [Salipiger mucosus DSM 16094]
MRVVVQGVGAIGGTVAAALALKGHEVLGIARGAQLETIRERGLTLRSPGGVQVAEFPCVADPSEVDWRPDDAVLLCMKTQHTAAALDQLVAAGVQDQPVFCVQNGVENERLALRRFANVHGVTVILPAEYLSPGEVAAFGAPCHGIFDIGRYPGGSDAADETLAGLLTDAGVQSFVMEDVMASKHGKLLMNLGNIVGAALGEAERADIVAALTEEGEAVLRACGIPYAAVDLSDPRREQYMQTQPVEGAARVGSSTAQSLVRGAGSVETDYLNGEIVLLGRQAGVPVPRNAWAMRLAARMLREGLAPGAVTRQEALDALGM